MRMLTSKVGNLPSCFDKDGESELNNDNTLKLILINNHNVDANKCEMKVQLPFDQVFGFCKTIKK